MVEQTLGGLLGAGDKVAVSNITGREAGVVTAASQRCCGNIVGGWALGKGGQRLDVPGLEPILVFSHVAGAGGEFLDQQDYGSPMDMRVSMNEITILGGHSLSSTVSSAEQDNKSEGMPRRDLSQTIW